MNIFLWLWQNGHINWFILCLAIMAFGYYRLDKRVIIIEEDLKWIKPLCDRRKNSIPVDTDRRQ